MLSFYDFPAEHWKHIRTTNPMIAMDLKATGKCRLEGAANGMAYYSRPFVSGNLSCFTALGRRICHSPKVERKGRMPARGFC